VIRNQNKNGGTSVQKETTERSEVKFKRTFPKRGKTLPSKKGGGEGGLNKGKKFKIYQTWARGKGIGRTGRGNRPWKGGKKGVWGEGDRTPKLAETTLFGSTFLGGEVPKTQIKKKRQEKTQSTKARHNQTTAQPVISACPSVRNNPEKAWDKKQRCKKGSPHAQPKKNWGKREKGL